MGICTIRTAECGDIGLIVHFIRGLAEYERLASEMAADETTLAKNLFGPRAYAECLLAFVDEKPAGFALYFHNFSTFTGKPGLYLEDIFVEPELRGEGVGAALFRELAKIAVARDCPRVEWMVLDWNEPAIGFYKRLGAEALDGWTKNRLSGEALEKLART